MSTVEMRCPRCGSPCALINKATSEYQCAHCNSTFRFVDPTKKTVLRGTIAHNCPKCGAPVKDAEGYICTECGTEWICQKCATRFEGKYVCNECLKKRNIISGSEIICPKCNRKLEYVKDYNQWYCHTCLIYPKHICPECGTMLDYVSAYNDFYCPKCGKYPSHGQKGNAAQYQGTTCPYCGVGHLTYIAKYQRNYCYNCQKYV